MVGMGEISMSWTCLTGFSTGTGGDPSVLGTLVGQDFWGIFNWHTRDRGSRVPQDVVARFIGLQEAE